MRKVLLLLDGIVAKELSSILIQQHLDKNFYIFVSQNKDILPSQTFDNVCTYLFDPASIRKLKNILDSSITDAIVALDDKEDRQAIYQTLRNYNKNIQITLLGRLDYDHDDGLLNSINQEQIIAQKLIERLPNVPKTARYIGLGIGEIMQVDVPFGSTYAYRAIGSIRQNTWKIVAIYRNLELILPKNSSVIFPNDSLLLVGKPKSLWDIYHRIREEKGQFPTPFGKDVILYLDMANTSIPTLIKEINQALWLFEKFSNKRLHICILNPNNFEFLDNLKADKRLKAPAISWSVQYHQSDLKQVITKDKATKNLGLILLNKKLFFLHKSFLFNLATPILKFGNQPLKDLQHSAIIIPKDTEQAEKISSSVFDFSTQLGLAITLFDFDPNGHYHKQAINYYKHIAKIFEKNIQIIQSDLENPIRWLKNQESTMQILPLQKENMKKPLLLSLTNTENLSTHLSSLTQLFIPLAI